MSLLMIIGVGLIGVSIVIFVVSVVYHSVKVNKVTQEVISEYTE